MISNKIVGLLLIALLLTGCISTKPIQIDQLAIDDVKLPKSNCALNLKLFDNRPSAELGTIGFREFQFENYPDYLQRQLDRRFLQVENKAVFEARLLRAYIETNRTTLSFNVVVKMLEPGAPPRIYRGDTTNLNFFGNQSELAAFMERATIELVEKIAIGEGCADSAAR